MSSTIKVFVSVALFLALSACKTMPRVNLDYDTDFDFSQLRSYQWFESNDPNQVITLNERRDINAIETMLNRKGYNKATSSDKADFLLTMHTITDKKTNIDSFYRGWGIYPLGWPGFNTTTYIREYEIGTLVLDIIDASRKEVVWRGTIASRLSVYAKRTPEERASLALKNAQILLEKFPPGLSRP